MKVRVITVATVGHLVLAAIAWFSTGALALGYGFKDKLTALESSLVVVVSFLTKILAAPAWFIYSSDEPWLKNIPGVIVLLLLVVNSFLQVNILFFAYNVLKDKLREPRKPG